MRAANTYRSARRNLMRDTREDGKGPKLLRFWKLSNIANEANGKARLNERAAQCREARMKVGLAMAASPRTFTLHDMNRVLREFWSTQKMTRVVWRILNVDLKLQPARG